MRIYPALVLRDTYLASLTEGGAYRPLTVEQAVEATAPLIAMFEEKGISWCLCEAEGWPYRFLTVPDGQHYEWANATLETAIYTYDDGGRTFQYCKELLDVFRKYTLN